MHFKYIYFKVNCITGLPNVILKLGFRSAFDGAVKVNTENSKCIELTMYLLSFLVEIKKVCSSSSCCNAHIRLFNSDGVGPNTRI